MSEHYRPWRERKPKREKAKRTNIRTFRRLKQGLKSEDFRRNLPPDGTTT